MTTTAGRSADGGFATVFTAVTGAAVILLAGLLVAAGAVFNAQEQGYDLAQSAARAGAQELDLAGLRLDGQIRLDPDRAIARAEQYLAQAGATGSATATTVSVTATATTRQRIPMLASVGVEEVTVTATGTATSTTTPTT